MSSSAINSVSHCIGQTPPIFPSLYAPIRGVKIRWISVELVQKRKKNI